jgi:hypothetical protein
MKIDGYTKVVLTGIAVFLGFIAFDYKPTINAQAASSGGGEMISSTSTDTETFLWLVKNGKVTICKNVGKPGTPVPRCSEFTDTPKWSD